MRTLHPCTSRTVSHFSAPCRIPPHFSAPPPHQRYSIPYLPGARMPFGSSVRLMLASSVE
jgi:hypothetical protein